MTTNIIDLNAYQSVVENIIAEGYVIVQLIIGGSVVYFAALEFNPPLKTQVTAVPYGQIRGCNITEFMRVNSGQSDRNLLIKRFKEQMENLPVIRVEFDERTNWYKWASSN